MAMILKIQSVESMEKERLKFSIERFDHYYDSVNNKSAVFLGLSTFIAGGLVAAYPALLDKVSSNMWIHILIAGSIGISIAIMIIVIRASTPFLSNNTDSVFYFGSVSCLGLSGFTAKSKAMGDDEELEDLRNQAFQLSAGLKGKFHKLKIAGILFTIQFFLFMPLVFLLIMN